MLVMNNPLRSKKRFKSLLFVVLLSSPIWPSSKKSKRESLYLAVLLLALTKTPPTPIPLAPTTGTHSPMPA